jgi:hypothetical protein
MTRRRHASIFMGYIASRRIPLLDFLPRQLKSGSRIKIIKALNAVPPSAKVTEVAWLIPWTPKLNTSVHIKVRTLL